MSVACIFRETDSTACISVVFGTSGFGSVFLCGGFFVETITDADEDDVDELEDSVVTSTRRPPPPPVVEFPLPLPVVVELPAPPVALELAAALVELCAPAVVVW